MGERCYRESEVASMLRAERIKERAAVVIWLRAQVNYYSNRHAQDLADKIEDSVHLGHAAAHCEHERPLTGACVSCGRNSP